MQPRNGVGVSDMRWVDGHGRHEPLPQLRLPGQIVSELTDVTRQPVGQQLRALARVGGEQSGQPARDRIAPTLAQFLLIIGGELAEVGGQGVAPRLVQIRVDDLQ